jgi:hypothetical protein
MNKSVWPYNKCDNVPSFHIRAFLFPKPPIFLQKLSCVAVHLHSVVFDAERETQFTFITNYKNFEEEWNYNINHKFLSSELMPNFNVERFLWPPFFLSVLLIRCFPTNYTETAVHVRPLARLSEYYSSVNMDCSENWCFEPEPVILRYDSP